MVGIKFFFNQSILKLTPTKNLPSIRTAIDGAMPIIIAPIVKKTSAAIMTVFLPYLSEKGPANKEPIADPSYAKETIV
jgi:hypothetical protein